MHTKHSLLVVIGWLPDDAERIFVGGEGGKLSFSTNHPELVDPMKFNTSVDPNARLAKDSARFRFRERP